jgi:hypothetical protein
MPRWGSVVGMHLDPFGLTQHVGILVPHPTWYAAVISFTRKGKLIQPVDIFTKGKDFDSVDYPSQTHPDAVVWAARTAVIHRPYNVISFNCDYFTRYCHGLTLESPQATRLTVAGILVAAGLAIAAASQT